MIYKIGVSLIIIHNLIASYLDILIGSVVAKHSIFLVTGSVFFLATVIFLLIAAIKREAPKALRSQSAFIDTLCLNVATAISWLSFYAALSLLEPAIVVALIGAVNPIATIMLNKLLRPQSRILPSDVHSAAGIFVVGGYVGWISMSGNSALPTISGLSSLLGLTAGFISTVALSVTTIYSKKLYDIGESTIGIMASRFWVLVIVSFALGNDVADFWNFVVQNAALVAGVAVFGVIVSLYLLQEGTRLCEPQVVEIVLASAPVFTFALQMLDERLVFSVHSAAANIIIAVIVGYGSYFHIKGQVYAS